MATVAGFEELEIWKLARAQANELFLLYNTGNFSRDYELKNQISRSSGSVMDNIAEGFERSGNKEFSHFHFIAKGSNGEVRSQLYRALDRKYITEETFKKLLAKNKIISSKITALLKYLKTSERKGFRYQ
jgi:four helix bundle protein